MANPRIWRFVSIPVLVTMLGCGGGSSQFPPPVPQASQPEFLYSIATIVNPPSFTSELLSFTLDPSTGTLSAPSSLTLTETSYALAVRPDAKFLYVSSGDSAAPGISTFSIDSKTGVPTPAGGFVQVDPICGVVCPLSAPGALATNSSGTSLYYGSNSFVGVVAQGIGALTSDPGSGALSGVSGSPFPANRLPLFVLVHPSGQFLYTEDISPAGVPVSPPLMSVSGYSIDATTGALAPVPGSPFSPTSSAEATGFVVHPSGTFLYASTGVAANGILAWNVDATTGKLIAMPGAPFLPGVATYNATFDPSGRFLYASAGPSGGILGFSVDANTGALTSLNGSPFFSTSVLVSLAVDPSGQWLVASGSDNAIHVFSLDAATKMPTAMVGSTAVPAIAESLTVVQAP